MSFGAAVGSHAESEASECCFTCAGACMDLSDHSLEFRCKPLLAIKGAASSYGAASGDNVGQHNMTPICPAVVLMSGVVHPSQHTSSSKQSCRV